MASVPLRVAGPAAAGSRYTVVATAKLADGLIYKKIVDSVGPNRIYVLTVNPGTQVTMDTALAGNKLGYFEKTTSMASRHGAIAAINGDFGISPGYPAHGYAEDGDLKITRTGGWGDEFAISQDETETHIAPPTYSSFIRRVDTGEQWGIHRWNYLTPSSDIVGYTPAGGSVWTPPGSSCYAQLQRDGGLMWSGSGVSVVQPYVVKKAACQNTPLSPQYGATLAADKGTTEGDQLASLTAGEAVQTRWSLGWRNVMDMIGGIPMLMEDGEVVATNCTDPVCYRNPRTGVGYRADGRILMVVVDGRRSGWSVGMTLLEFAKLFKYLGADTAMNMDGGGSSTMVVKGKIKNRPSDSTGQRAVSSALLVLNGPDTGEPVPAPWATASSSLSTSAATSTAASVSSPGEAAAAARAAALDPGSTGGMVDALARGAFGFRPSLLPPDYLEVLRLFRGQGGGGRL